MRRITFEEYRLVCIQYGLFTCGTNDQYVKASKMINLGCSVGDLALVTWLCSDSRFSLEEITSILANHFVRGY